VIVELGCGTTPTDRADIHHDRTKHSDFIDVVHDLDDLPWPFGDESVDELIAIDVFEHLHPREYAQPWWFWLDEAHRIVRPNGQLTMRLPAWDNPLSYRDPTHTRVFHHETFAYWDPCTPVWRDFGRIYDLSGERFWHSVVTARENNDIRFLLRKLPTDLCPASPEART
jgi:SAM-dependent methyltransferase